MNNYIVLKSDELYHHGVKGMKWGVRKDRYSDGQSRTRMTSQQKRKIAKAAAIGIGVAAGTGLAIYATKNPQAVIAAAKFGKTKVMSFMSKYGPKMASAAGKAAKAVGSKGVNVATKVGKKAGTVFEKSLESSLNAALTTVGVIEIGKLSDRLTRDDSVDENTRNKNTIIFNSAKAAIETATKANTNSSNNNNNNNNSNNSNNNNKTVGAEVTNVIGKPSNEGIDRSSKEYQQLFKTSSGDQRPDKVRSDIKSLASAGYDLNQIRTYLNKLDDGTLSHGDRFSLVDAYSYIGSEFLKEKGIVT